MTVARITKGERTRAKLTAATAALLQRKGFHATGMADIVAASGAPRGSVYFHFPGGKEELVEAALREASATWRARIDAVLDGAADLGAAVVGVCELLAHQLVDSGYELGCPLATVALETASESHAVQRTCVAHFNEWEVAIARRLERDGFPVEMVHHLATLSLSAIEGALLLAKIKRSPEPLLSIGKTLQMMIAMAPRPPKPSRR